MPIGPPDVPADATQALDSLQLSARRCPAMQQALDQLLHLARDGRSVWLCGEPGAGRHTAALALQALSPRHAEPLITGPTVPAPERLAYLLQRRVIIPPLRQRREEIVSLATDLLRRHARAPQDHDEAAIGPCLSDDAAAVLEDHPWPGNLWQLQHVMSLLGARVHEPVIGAADLASHLPGHGFGEDAGRQPDGLAPDQLAQALLALLRPLLPLLPAAPLDIEERPWSPLLLIGAPDAPPEQHALQMGPAPIDEGRLASGLQARPISNVGSTGGAGFRTGDAAALGRLGPTWRGRLLALLRAIHQVLEAEPGQALGLGALGQLLLLAGPPIPADKLVRLGLQLPVELQEDETAAALERLGQAPRGTPACTDPALGRTWADALRGLVPQAAVQRFHVHAQGCERCQLVLPAFWRLSGSLTPPDPSATDLPAERTVADHRIGAPEEWPEDKTQTRIGSARAPQSLLPLEASPSSQTLQAPPEEATSPVFLPEQRQPEAGDTQPRRASAATTLPVVQAASSWPSSASPTPAPTLWSMLTAGHLATLTLLLVLMLLLGAILGVSLVRWHLF